MAATIGFFVTINVYDSAGNVLPYSGQATLSAAGQSGNLPITPTSIRFVNGTWSGNVTIASADTNVTLQVSDGILTAVSNVFTVKAPLHVATTNPIPDGVILYASFSSEEYLDIKFSEPINPSSLLATDLTFDNTDGLLAYTVSNVVLLDNNTTARFTLVHLQTGTYTATIDAGALTDLYGLPNTAFSATYYVGLSNNYFTEPFTAALGPDGSLIYKSEDQLGAITSAGQVNSYTVQLDAGQTLSVLAQPGNGSALQPNIQMFDPNGGLIGTGASNASGADAVIETVMASATGTYTIAVGSVGSTIGSYTLTLYLNAALESESYGGVSDNTLTSAQDINNSFISLTSSATRGAVLGIADGESRTDCYSFTLAAGDVVTLGLTKLASGTMQLSLVDALGNVVASGAGNASNLTKVVSTYHITTAGTYYASITGYASVTGTSNVPYSLVITREAAFETERNDTIATAQDISTSHNVLGSLHMEGCMGLKMGLIEDSAPWKSAEEADIATQLGYSVTLIPTSSLGTVNLSAYDVVVLACNQTAAGYAAVQANLGRIGAYVSAGGVWLANFAADPFTYPYSYHVLPGATGVTFSVSSASVHILSPSSRLVNGPYGNVANDGDKLRAMLAYGYTTSTLPTGATAILSLANSSQVTAFDYPYGSGHAIVQTTPIEAYNGSFCPTNFLENLFAYAASFTLSASNDWYKISVTGAGTISLQTSTTANTVGETQSNLSPMLELYNPSGVKVATGTVGPDGRNQSLQYKATTPGVYYVHVQAAGVHLWRIRSSVQHSSRRAAQSGQRPRLRHGLERQLPQCGRSRTWFGLFDPGRQRRATGDITLDKH